MIGKLISNQIYVYCIGSHISKSIQVIEKLRFLKLELESIKYLIGIVNLNIRFADRSSEQTNKYGNV